MVHIILNIVKEVVTMKRDGNDTIALANNETMTSITFNYYISFTNCIKEININQIDNTKHLYIVVSIHRELNYNDKHSKPFRNQYLYPTSKPYGNLINFQSEKFKTKCNGTTTADSTQIT